MIAVIADDFTGAAEIGGIGLRHGLKVVIETVPENGHDADLLVVATDTRSMNSKDAAKHIKYITKEILKLNPTLLYKKVDSVLRGNIEVELIAQMEAMGLNRSIVIAANPIFKRTIQDGQYLIDETPLNETCFSSDPQYPISSSKVIDIIANDTNDIVNIKHNENLPSNGIIVGDVLCFEDLTLWAEKNMSEIVIAGASGFFNALLEKHTGKTTTENQNNVHFGEKSLFVLGSTYPKDKDFFRNIEEKGYFISNMPEEIYNNPDFDQKLLDEWVSKTVFGIKSNQKVVTCINHPINTEKNIADRIKRTVGILVRKVIEQIAIDELLIEGGSTTFEVLDELGVRKLFPVSELDTGVIRMNLKEKGFFLTTKPGSYFWPDDVWGPNDIHKLKKVG